MEELMKKYESYPEISAVLLEQQLIESRNLNVQVSRLEKENQDLKFKLRFLGIMLGDVKVDLGGIPVSVKNFV